MVQGLSEALQQLQEGNDPTEGVPFIRVSPEITPHLIQHIHRHELPIKYTKHENDTFTHFHSTKYHKGHIDSFIAGFDAGKGTK